MVENEIFNTNQGVCWRKLAKILSFDSYIANAWMALRALQVTGKRYQFGVRDLFVQEQFLSRFKRPRPLDSLLSTFFMRRLVKMTKNQLLQYLHAKITRSYRYRAFFFATNQVSYGPDEYASFYCTFEKQNCTVALLWFVMWKQPPTALFLICRQPLFRSMKHVIVGCFTFLDILRTKKFTEVLN